MFLASHDCLNNLGRRSNLIHFVVCEKTSKTDLKMAAVTAILDF